MKTLHSHRGSSAVAAVRGSRRSRRAATAVIAALTCAAAVAGGVLLLGPRPAAPGPAAETGPAAALLADAACSWQRRDFDPAMPTRYTYAATCDGVGALQASIEDGSRLTGTLGGRALVLALEPGSDPAMFDVTWRGTLDDVALLLRVRNNEVVDGSAIGQAGLTCAGPAVLAGDWSWLRSDVYRMPVSYVGDPSVARSEASALCNLLTVGLPASSFGFAKGLLEPPVEG